MRRWIPAFLMLASSVFAADAPLYFIQLTDPQFGMYGNNTGYAQESANYSFAVATVNRLRPAFVVVTGDLVNKAGDAGQVAEYLRISAQIDRSIPVYHLPGNHDVGNEPTPASLAAYRKKFGRDYYSFRAGPVYGIVLNSQLIFAPQTAMGDYEAQESWLRSELEKAKASGARHILVFQHHPYFIKDAGEKDAYENIPLERRRKYLDLFRSYGVRYVFAGHYHQNASGRDGEIELITTGAVGKPLRQSRSGLRVAAVKADTVEHKYWEFGMLPEKLAGAEK